MYYRNENIVNLNRIFDQNSREGYLRLDLNENPVGLPNDFIQKVLKDVDSEFVAKYPETEFFQNYLSSFVGVKPNELCVTNGSAEAIRHIFEAFSRPGGKIVCVAPSYAMYEIFAKMYGREFIPVAYDGFSINVDKIIDAIDEETDIVVLLNPNNPIGNVYTDEEVQRVLECAQKFEATVLIDEAYLYFYPHSLIDLAKQYNHVLITRTFSKLFSLAGCRLGYCIGSASDIELVQKLCTPHNVNAFSMKFAYEIMNTEGMIDQLMQTQKQGRDYLVEELQKRNYVVHKSHGNFMFIETKTDSAEVTKKLKEHRILVKHYALPDYSNCIRVTTGPQDTMEKFIHVLCEVDV